MALNSKRPRVEVNDSHDSESGFVFMEKAIEGMDVAEESELDRLLADDSEISR